jgi:hypothetical protein
MPQSHVTAFFLFDIGDSIDLSRVRGQIEARAAARLPTRPAAPTYVQYQPPPLIVDGHTMGLSDIDGFQVRFKLFEYGVLSVALTRHLADTWERLLDTGLEWQDNPDLAANAERLCRDLVSKIPQSVARPRDTVLTEDYVVFTMLADANGPAADVILASYGPAIAQLLRGDRETLSAQERDEVLRHRMSYYTTDMVVVTWSSALIYDTSVGAPGTLEILEFANSQLLEFRYYDHLLNAELSRIYARLQASRWRLTWLGGRYARAARQVHALFIDVNELTDRAENALKIVGDVYAARLFGMAAARLGLDQWKANVREKLETVDDIYRFAVEHTSMVRGEFLELIVVILILLEIVLLIH